MASNTGEVDAMGVDVAEVVRSAPVELVGFAPSVVAEPEEHAIIIVDMINASPILITNSIRRRLRGSTGK